jgi:hypothetical protein
MATRRRFARTLGLAATMFKVFSGLYIALPPHHDIHIPLPNLTVQSVYISPHTTHLTYPSRTSKGLNPYNSRQHPPPVKLSTASRLLSNPHALTITPKDIINVPFQEGTMCYIYEADYFCDCYNHHPHSCDCEYYSQLHTRINRYAFWNANGYCNNVLYDVRSVPRECLNCRN